MKFSSEPPTAALFFVGNSRRRDWNFRARSKISIEIENFERDQIFLIVGPSGKGGHPDLFRFVPIFPVFFRFVPICVPCYREYPDLFRFAPFSSDLLRFVFRTDQNKSGKPLSADPLLQRMRLFCLQLEASCLQWSFLLTAGNFSFFGAFLLTSLAFLLTVGASLLTVGKCV